MAGRRRVVHGVAGYDDPEHGRADDRKALGVPPLGMKAALTSYTISLAVFIPVRGWIADRFGTRRVFFSAMGVFTIGSLLCGLSTNMTLLVASRILQGVGGALMMQVGRIAIVRTFPKSKLLAAAVRGGDDSGNPPDTADARSPHHRVGGDIPAT